MQDGGREKSITLQEAHPTSFPAVLQREGAGGCSKTLV